MVQFLGFYTLICYTIDYFLYALDLSRRITIMSFITLLITAIALAADASAVSLAGGLTCHSKKQVYTSAIRAGLAFGLFQGAMTFIGWAMGLTFQNFITSFDHWIAFGLLFFIGVKMIKEAFGDEEESSISLDSNKTLIILAIATSIDALAVGISLAVLQLTLLNILVATLTITLVTLILSMLGVWLGSCLKHKSNLGMKINIAGGVVLILIGLKILVEHLFFA